MLPNRLRLIVCPKCGFGIKIDPSRAFTCKCGYSTKDNPPIIREENQENIPKYALERKNKCEKCDIYNNYRCPDIELGCRPAYIAYIRDPKTKCPRGVWGPVEENS